MLVTSTNDIFLSIPSDSSFSFNKDISGEIYFLKISTFSNVIENLQFHCQIVRYYGIQTHCIMLAGTGLLVTIHFCQVPGSKVVTIIYKSFTNEDDFPTTVATALAPMKLDGGV